LILHIVKRVEWDCALELGHYAPDSLRTEGFIHCSTVAQVMATANLYYRGQNDLVLLCIDEERLTTPLNYESPIGSGTDRHQMSFPHIYGPLTAAAVKRVIDFPCEPDGSFLLPPSLLGLIWGS
jgi:uncharacterized protein (DUF952 family)